MLRVVAAFFFYILFVSAQPLDQKVHEMVDKVPFAVSLFAKNLDSGESYGLRQDERVPTASTIKLAIMTAVFDAIEHKRAKWTDKITLHDSDKVDGTGVIRELSNGVQLPVRDLVHLMIVVSDNTATNLLIDKFSANAVNDEMDSLGLKNTRSNRKVLIDGKPPSGISKAGKLPENESFGLGVSTPHEMAILIEKMERGELVSKNASRDMITILKRQQLRYGIARRMGELPVASKSGALNLMRSDVGIVYSPGGRIAIAITCQHLPGVDYSPDNPGDVLIADLSKMLVEALAKK